MSVALATAMWGALRVAILRAGLREVTYPTPRAPLAVVGVSLSIAFRILLAERFWESDVYLLPAIECVEGRETADSRSDGSRVRTTVEIERRGASFPTSSLWRSAGLWRSASANDRREFRRRDRTRVVAARQRVAWWFLDRVAAEL